MQRTMIFLMALLLLATACSGGENSEELVPALLPTVMEEEDAAEESPRVETTLDARVPPTWTPSSLRPPSAPLPAGTVASPAAGDDGGQTVADGEVYVVQAGDTLAELAAEFGVELELLAEANNIADIDHIEVGQELVIPGGVAPE